jgi:hypothetical protein
LLRQLLERAYRGNGLHERKQAKDFGRTADRFLSQVEWSIFQRVIFAAHSTFGFFFDSMKISWLTITLLALTVIATQDRLSLRELQSLPARPKTFLGRWCQKGLISNCGSKQHINKITCNSNPISPAGKFPDKKIPQGLS